MAAVQASAHLNNMGDVVRWLDKHLNLAHTVSHAIGDSCTLTRNTSLRDGLYLLKFAPDILESAGNAIDDAAESPRTAKALLEETASTVEAAIERVPVDADAALLYLQQTLGRVDQKLQTVLRILNWIVRIIKKNVEKLEHMNEFLIEAIESPELDGGFWRRDQSKELLRPMRELSNSLTEDQGPIQILRNALLFLEEYVRVLQRLADGLREGTIDDNGGARWTTMAALQALARAGDPMSVAPAVARNLEVMTGLLDAVLLS
ncbi:uncharacterized protein J3D65DRAFT_666702 [Phyllosticta citribraziliensis]|uniref:Uncharacterized protein n=1 Tax=Phyllosticta citribraziliensis TaxID=989973 RepID=A0ABR1LZN3_9PEZI